jgi:hypothetical protein
MCVFIIIHEHMPSVISQYSRMFMVLSSIIKITFLGNFFLWIHKKRSCRDFLDNQLTDGGEVVSFMHRPPFTSHENSWYSLLLEAESTPGP